MGSGDWLKNIISTKKSLSQSNGQTKDSTPSKNSKRFKWKHQNKGAAALPDVSGADMVAPRVLTDYTAAVVIQTAIRGFLARTTLRRLKGVARFKVLIQGRTVQTQTSSTSHYIHLWNMIHSDVRARRQSMVIETRARLKKQDEQIKLDAKLHEIEVEWCGGSESIDEIVSRVHKREEAAVKRERAMAYAFTHQWRTNPRKAGYDLGKDDWGWSWMENCITTKAWETRQTLLPLKANDKQGSKPTNSPVLRVSNTVKSAASDSKGAVRNHGNSNLKRALFANLENRPPNGAKKGTPNNMDGVKSIEV